MRETATGKAPGHTTRRQVLGGAAAGLMAALIGLKSAYAKDKKLKVGLIMPNYDQLRWRNADQAFFEKEAAKLGIEVLAQSSEANESLQASQVENMLTQGIDVLVLTPVNANAANALVRKARAVSVPVINYNFLINNGDVACFLGRDATEMGEKIAKAAVAAHPKGNYVIAAGEESTSVARETRQGFLNVLKPFLDKGDIKLVSDQFNKNWSTDTARAQVENALTRNNNDVVVVLCGNDGTAYGAIQALQAQGLGGKVFVTGVDAEPRAQELIKQGLMALSNFTAFDQMGVEAARAAQAVGNGQPVQANATVNNGAKQIPWIKILNFNVTKDNLVQSAKDFPWWFEAKA
ncbi:MAG: substrate-binding domain-containing protein [Microvirga sp.]